MDFIIYTGADTDVAISKAVGVSYLIVIKLMKRYLRKNRILFIDIWYSSSTLFEELHNNDTGAIRTVRKNRTGALNGSGKLELCIKTLA